MFFVGLMRICAIDLDYTFTLSLLVKKLRNAHTLTIATAKYVQASKVDRLTMRISPLAIHQLANRLLQHQQRKGRRKLSIRQFRAFFGCSPRVAAALWNRIHLSAPSRFTPSRLLWTLAFLKIYCSEDVLSTFLRCSAPTLRKWVWIGIDILGDIDLVSRTDRSVDRSTDRFAFNFACWL